MPPQDGMTPERTPQHNRFFALYEEEQEQNEHKTVSKPGEPRSEETPDVSHLDQVWNSHSDEDLKKDLLGMDGNQPDPVVAREVVDALEADDVIAPSDTPRSDEDAVKLAQNVFRDHLMDGVEPTDATPHSVQNTTEVDDNPGAPYGLTPTESHDQELAWSAARVRVGSDNQLKPDNAGTLDEWLAKAAAEKEVQSGTTDQQNTEDVGLIGEPTSNQELGTNNTSRHTYGDKGLSAEDAATGEPIVVELLDEDGKPESVTNGSTKKPEESGPDPIDPPKPGDAGGGDTKPPTPDTAPTPEPEHQLSIAEIIDSEKPAFWNVLAIYPGDGAPGEYGAQRAKIKALLEAGEYDPDEIDDMTPEEAFQAAQDLYFGYLAGNDVDIARRAVEGALRRHQGDAIVNGLLADLNREMARHLPRNLSPQGADRLEEWVMHDIDDMRRPAPEPTPVAPTAAEAAAERNRERDGLRSEFLLFIVNHMEFNPKMPITNEMQNLWFNQHGVRTEPGADAFIKEAQSLATLANLSMAKRYFTGGKVDDFVTYLTDRNAVTDAADRNWADLYKGGAVDSVLVFLLRAAPETDQFQHANVSEAIQVLIEVAEGNRHINGIDWTDAMKKQVSGSFDVEKRLLAAVITHSGGRFSEYEVRVAFMIYELTIEPEYSESHPLTAFVRTRANAEGLRGRNRWGGSIHWFDKDADGDPANPLPEYLWKPVGVQDARLNAALKAGQGVDHILVMLEEGRQGLRDQDGVIKKSFEAMGKAAGVYQAIMAVGPKTKESGDFRPDMLTKVKGSLNGLSLSPESGEVLPIPDGETPAAQRKREWKQANPEGYLDREARLDILANVAVVFFKEISVESGTLSQPGAKSIRAVDPYSAWVLWVALTQTNNSGQSYFDEHSHKEAGVTVWETDEEALLTVREQVIRDVRTFHDNRAYWDAIPKDRVEKNQRIYEARNTKFRDGTYLFPVVPHRSDLTKWENNMMTIGVAGAISNFRPLKGFDQKIDDEVDRLNREGGAVNKAKALLLRLIKTG